MEVDDDIELCGIYERNLSDTKKVPPSENTSQLFFRVNGSVRVVGEQQFRKRKTKDEVCKNWSQNVFKKLTTERVFSVSCERDNPSDGNTCKQELEDLNLLSSSTVDGTNVVSTSNYQSLKECTVVLNRCDEIKHSSTERLENNMCSYEGTKSFKELDNMTSTSNILPESYKILTSSEKKIDNNEEKFELSELRDTEKTSSIEEKREKQDTCDENSHGKMPVFESDCSAELQSNVNIDSKSHATHTFSRNGKNKIRSVNLEENVMTIAQNENKCKVILCNYKTENCKVSTVSSGQKRSDSNKKYEQQLEEEFSESKVSETVISRLSSKTMCTNIKSNESVCTKMNEKNKHHSHDSDVNSGEKVTARNKSERTLFHKVAIRRSSRNVKKQISFETNNDDQEIKEIIPTDPLASDSICTTPCQDCKKGKAENSKNNTIVVNNTEQLFQIANGKGVKRKKEPTLVIIDTNSILSGRGPVPISQISIASSYSQTPTSAGYSLLSTISGSRNVSPTIAHYNSNNSTISTTIKSSALSSKKPQLITNNMFFIEAPSFIVPVLYRQPPKTSLKEYIEKLENDSVVHEDIEQKITCIGNRETCNTNQSSNDADMNSNVKEANSESFQKEIKNEDSNDKHSGKCLSDLHFTKNELRTKDCIQKITDDSIVHDEKSACDVRNSNLVCDAPIKERTKDDRRSDKSNQEYFNSSLGKFFIQIGFELVKEYVLVDEQRKGKQPQCNKDRKQTQTLEFCENLQDTNLEFSERNKNKFHFQQRKCVCCDFETESSLVMAHHLETPHMLNNAFKCNFCSTVIESRSSIVYHMVTEHDMQIHLECTPAIHQCPNCPFEDNNKTKVNCHMVSCSRKHKPNRNQEPPSSWEPPAKLMHLAHIQPLKRGKNILSSHTSHKNVRNLLPKLPPGTVVYHAGTMLGQHDLLSLKDQIGANQKHQVTGKKMSVTTVWQRPNVSITPLPNIPTVPTSATIFKNHGSQRNSVSLLNKIQKIHICEICDTRFMVFADLKGHLQDLHQVKFSKKTTYSAPSLGCQKCPLRFFSDQGLERHLLGTHSLVTTNIQEAANQEKDGGHCPVCAKLFQWKLLEHMTKDHKMILKPVNISYKCTLCNTVTFGKYKEFEDHVFSLHNATRSRKTSDISPLSRDGILKSLKKNNEITIISQSKRNPSVNDVTKLSHKNKDSKKISEYQLHSKNRAKETDSKPIPVKEDMVTELNLQGEEFETSSVSGTTSDCHSKSLLQELYTKNHINEDNTCSDDISDIIRSSDDKTEQNSTKEVPGKYLLENNITEQCFSKDVSQAEMLPNQTNHNVPVKNGHLDSELFDKEEDMKQCRSTEEQDQENCSVKEKCTTHDCNSEDIKRNDTKTIDQPNNFHCQTVTPNCKLSDITSNQQRKTCSHLKAKEVQCDKVELIQLDDSPIKENLNMEETVLELPGMRDSTEDHLRQEKAFEHNVFRPENDKTHYIDTNPDDNSLLDENETDAYPSKELEKYKTQNHSLQYYKKKISQNITFISHEKLEGTDSVELNNTQSSTKAKQIISNHSIKRPKQCSEIEVIQIDSTPEDSINSEIENSEDSNIKEDFSSESDNVKLQNEDCDSKE